MRIRTVAVILAVASIAIAASVAQGAPNRHQVKLTVKDATITSQATAPGNRQTTVGLVSGKPFGTRSRIDY